MKILDRITKELEYWKTVNQMYSDDKKMTILMDEEPGQSIRKPTMPIGREITLNEKKKADRQQETKNTIVFLNYDKERNEYIWDEWTDVKKKDISPDAVHITGKNRHYLWTDLWDELIWAKEGQSAIHSHLWMVSNKLDADALSEKKSVDTDMKKYLIYGAIAVAVVIIGWGFIPKG